MTKAKRHAVLLRNNRVIGVAFTAATNGSIVSYGTALVDPVTEMPAGIHEFGRAKISRNAVKMKSVLSVRKPRPAVHEADLTYASGYCVPEYDVNDGGGVAY
jgi:hypothetical protein